MKIFGAVRPVTGLRLPGRYWIGLFGILLFAAVYIPLAHQMLTIDKQLPTSVSAAPVATKKSVPAPVAPAPVASATPRGSQSVHAASPALPACTQSTFGTPAALSLSGTTGETVQNDAPTYYQIYGYTATQLRSQIQRCGPGASAGPSAEFTGRTAYTITWLYDYTNAGGTCTISNARVGVHTGVALPYWAAPSTSTPGLADSWQKFVSSLAVHEQGHVALNDRYAAVIASDLQAIGPTSCAGIATTVNAVANGDLATLNNANDAYDSATNHGATQGAILP